MNRRLLGPLGMGSSTLDLKGFLGAPNRVSPHRWRNGRAEPIPDDWPFQDWVYLYGPAGGLNASLLDMTRWTAFQLSGEVEGRVLLKPETRAYLHRPQTVAGDGSAFYCLGWVRDRRKAPSADLAQRRDLRVPHPGAAGARGGAWAGGAHQPGRYGLPGGPGEAVRGSVVPEPGSGLVRGGPQGPGGGASGGSGPLGAAGASSESLRGDLREPRIRSDPGGPPGRGPSWDLGGPATPPWLSSPQEGIPSPWSWEARKPWERDSSSSARKGCRPFAWSPWTTREWGGSIG